MTWTIRFLAPLRLCVMPGAFDTDSERYMIYMSYMVNKAVFPSANLLNL